MNKFIIRNATPQDTAILFDFIHKMAQYEKLESEMDTSVEWLLGKRMGFRLDLPSSFIIFPPSKDNGDYISKSCLSKSLTAGKGTAKPCCCTSYKLQSKENAVAWIGWFWIGTLLPLHFTNRLELFLWKIGPFIA